MRFFLTGGAAALALTGLALAQSDNRQVPIDEFERLEAGGNFDLVFVTGEAATLRMDGDPDDIEDIEIDRRGDALVIRQHRGIRRFWGGYRHLDVTIYVSAPAVNAFEFSRGVEAGLSDLNTADMSLNVSTGAEVDISGTCGHVAVNVSTGAELDARDLVCDSVRINASTGSEAAVHARESLVANVSTGADVYSQTDPANLRMNTSTGGDVRVGSGS